MTPADFLENTVSGWVSVAMAERSHIFVWVWHFLCASWRYIALHAFAVVVYLISSMAKPK
jgi:hypothetical protein